MFFRKKRRPNPMPMPPWMKWGVAGFILLIITVRSLAPPSNTPSSITTLKNSIDLKPYEKAITRQKEPEIEELKAGNGPLLLCGQQVHLFYRLHKEGDAAQADAPAPEATPLSFRVGAGEGPLIIERGITGMRVDSIRRVSFSPPLPQHVLTGQPEAADEPNIQSIDIGLERTEPDSAPLMDQPDHLPLRLYDMRPGSGLALLCGEELPVHLTLWDASGEKLFDTRSAEQAQPLTLRPGMGQLPAGLELGVIGMQPGGRRTIILPPEWQKPMDESHNLLVQSDSPFHKLELPRRQLIVADVEYISTQHRPNKP